MQKLGLAAVGWLAGCSSGGPETATPTGTPVGPEATEMTGTVPPYADFVPDTADAVVGTMFDLQVDSGYRVSTPPETVSDPLRYSSMMGAYVGSLVELSVYTEAEDRAVIAKADGTLAGLTTDAAVFTPPRVDAESPERIRDIVDTRAGARQPKHETDDSVRRRARLGRGHRKSRLRLRARRR